MKISHVICVVIMLVSTSSLFGQTKSDSLLIKETALNYIEGLWTNNYERMEKAIHPELAKRVIRKDDKGNYRLSNMGYSELLFYTKTLTPKDEKPEEPFKADVIIFDIASDIATIKITQNKYSFFDYVQLGKINGEWKMINWLWANTK
ncbi:nuclear transport factor 2 family protein [Algoriphagus hitonicola]|uniref:Putative lumazine-binding n=1 Tax=Algoriphagus hitonicola TaxID=435880 RepID=A0A1I2Q6S2_9BACT|nr:nuclear transport factor 2 family protein [Algoriphagus hitonicola]SFG21977.1 Putative lumazine-binding [Algoriphagus hitonicola]